MLYRIKNLIKSYEERVVLDLYNLSMEEGRVIGLLGPNGAGKTTLLEVMGFLLPPTSGEVWYKKERVDFNDSNIINLRQKVVLVQQQPILFTGSVFNNVEFPLKIRKRPKQERQEIVEELLSLVGMEDFRYAKAHKLSGGETQRVAIAQALACSPDVILLDEPTASVDVENQITIERLIGDINRKKSISIIFTTHDMVQASRVADEIVFIFEGKVAESIHENIFSGRIDTDPKGQKYCELQDGLKISLQTERSGPVRISINPGAINISKGLSNAPNENCYKGRLIQLTDELSRVRALVDIGVPLSVMISKEVAKSLNLTIGEEVSLTCPPGSIEIF